MTDTCNRANPLASVSSFEVVLLRARAYKKKCKPYGCNPDPVLIGGLKYELNDPFNLELAETTDGDGTAIIAVWLCQKPGTIIHDTVRAPFSLEETMHTKTHDLFVLAVNEERYYDSGSEYMCTLIPINDKGEAICEHRECRRLYTEATCKPEPEEPDNA